MEETERNQEFMERIDNIDRLKSDAQDECVLMEYNTTEFVKKILYSADINWGVKIEGTKQIWYRAFVHKGQTQGVCEVVPNTDGVTVKFIESDNEIFSIYVYDRILQQYFDRLSVLHNWNLKVERANINSDFLKNSVFEWSI